MGTEGSTAPRSWRDWGDVFGTLRRANGLISRRRRRLLVVVALLSLVVSGLEAVSALLVLVLVRLVTDPGAALKLPMVGDLEQLFPERTRDALIVGLAAAFLAFFVVRGVLFLLQQYVTARVVQNSGVEISHRLLRAYLAAPYEFHLSRNSAESMRNVYENVRQLVSGTFVPMVTVFTESVLVCCMLAVLVVADPLSTLLAAVVLGATVLLTLLLVQPRLKELGRRRQTATRDAIQHVQQGLQGIRDIKVARCEATFAGAYSDARSRVARAEYLRTTIAYVPRIAIEMAFLVFVVGLLVISRVDTSVVDLVSTLGLFVYAGLRIQPSLQKITGALNNLRYGETVVDELSADFVQLGIDVEGADGGAVEEVEPLPFEDELRVERIAFSYDPTANRVLDDVSFTLRPGESLGVAGPTGSGKSTLLDVVCGLVTPQAGQVTVDNVDIALRLHAWHRAIGVVHQQAFLTDDTIRRNIALGVPDHEIDEDQVRRVVAAAALQPVVDELEHGLDTPLGERGIRLSGGQRQRVALARALYRRPRLLILDEATSALDNTTERQVIENIEHLADDIAIIAVAHRMRTIMACDRVLLLSAGRVVGAGTFDELVESNAEFAALSS